MLCLKMSLLTLVHSLFAVLVSLLNAELTSVVEWGRRPGKQSLPGSRWNTSRRSGTCQQEAQILVNYTVPHSTANHRQRTGGQSPNGTGHGQGRVPQAEQAGSGSAEQQEVVITTASHDFEGGGVRVRGRGGWVWRCMVGQGKSKPMLTSQPLEGRTDKANGPGTRQDKHPRQHTAESQGKAQISNLDMTGWATTSTITANRAGAESTGAKREKGTGAGSCSTGRNMDNEQIWTNKHRQLLSCPFKQLILKCVLSHSSEWFLFVL